MDQDIKRNGSGYYDPTCYKALKNILRNGDKEMEFFKGDIFTGELNNGNEREFIILSSHSNFSTVLMLSDNESLPYSVKCNGLKFTNPAMLQYMYNNKLTNYIRSMSKDEIDDLMEAVIDSLDYKPSWMDRPLAITSAADIEPVPASEPVFSEDALKLIFEAEELKVNCTKAQAERDVYKKLYEDLLNNMIGR